MNWQSIDDKHKKKYDRNFVACDEHDERDYLVNLIYDSPPYFMRVEIEKAVDSCFISFPGIPPRDQFLQCLKKKLQPGS